MLFKLSKLKKYARRYWKWAKAPTHFPWWLGALLLTFIVIGLGVVWQIRHETKPLAVVNHNARVTYAPLDEQTQTSESLAAPAGMSIRIVGWPWRRRLRVSWQDGSGTTTVAAHQITVFENGKKAATVLSRDMGLFNLEFMHLRANAHYSVEVVTRATDNTVSIPLRSVDMRLICRFNLFCRLQ